MVAVIAIVIVTALVIAAWKFGGTPDPKVAGVNAPADRRAAQRRLPGRPSR